MYFLVKYQASFKKIFGFVTDFDRRKIYGFSF